MSRTILLADDSLTIQKVVELTFADTDYAVIAVSSGDELLERLPECRPDLVICDVIMPGRDGYDVCQEIKSNADSLHVPVILLTGTFEPFDRDRALAVGCSEIITKPFEARKLVEAVDRLSSTEGAAPPPAPPTVEVSASEVEVTPPPPMDAPVDFSEDAFEIEDTAVTADDEESATGFVAKSADDEGIVLSTEEEIAESVENEQADFELADESADDEDVVLPAEEEFTESVEDEQADFELADDQTAAEGEPSVPSAAAPPSDAEVFSEAPDTGETLAATDVPETIETNEDEVFADRQPPDPAEDPFPAEAAHDEVFPNEGQEHEEPADAGEYIDNTMTTPIDVEAVMAGESPEGEEAGNEIELESAEVDPSDADTQDITEKVSPQEPADETESTGLSDEDVDRVARRLLELAGDRIEHIAWEIIPDMAEVVVRERVREIEAAAQRD